jgi:galactosylceramide sulfotransferase
MLWDAGLPARSMNNATAVRAKIQEMEDTFQLVMLAERFDESMVLMKDLLCWDYRQDPLSSCVQ